MVQLLRAQLFFEFIVLEFLFWIVVKFVRIIVKMKSIYSILLCAIALVTSQGCSSMHDFVLESKDVQFFKVEALHDSPVRLRLSGLAFNSSMSVSRIETKTDSSVITVFVYLSVAKKGMSGSFSYDLAVPDSVNEVRFGNEATPVWKRSSVATHS